MAHRHRRYMRKRATPMHISMSANMTQMNHMLSLWV